MKKNLFLWLMAAVVMTSCGTRAENQQKEETAVRAEKISTIYLTADDFMTKVIDLEANPDQWEYLGDKPAVIDFYTTWCPPCKVLAPRLEELAAEYEGKIYVYKVDIEKETRVQGILKIQSIPTMFFLPVAGEGEPQVVAGLKSKAELKKMIDAML